MRHRILSIVAVSVALVVAGVSPALASSAASGPSTAAASAADTGSAATDVTQTAQECDYEQLYDETIPSVALIQTERGLGSAFVYNVTDNGTAYIVTNQHVVAGAESVRVRFARGETVPGTVVGTDVRTDLAVVRVTDPPAYADALPIATEDPDPGQRVAALGSPFGLESTITSGIVSGTNRSIPIQGGLAPPVTIQTDAPINPGNSGGPLVTCPGGTVLGVNRAGGAENIGFAVPASIVRRVVPALIEEGEFDHPFLGVQLTELSPAVVQANDLNRTEGVLVVNTLPGSPAEGVLQASERFEKVGGIPVPVGGDVIVGIDNRSVETAGDLSRFLALEASPGETVELTVIRDGERQTVNVTLAERPESESV